MGRTVKVANSSVSSPYQANFEFVIKDDMTEIDCIEICSPDAPIYRFEVSRLIGNAKIKIYEGNNFPTPSGLSAYIYPSANGDRLLFNKNEKVQVRVEVSHSGVPVLCALTT